MGDGRVELRLTPDQALEWERFVQPRLPAGATHFRLRRRSIDARRGRAWLQLAVEWSDRPLEPLSPAPPPLPERSAEAPRVVVVGAGPAGLMAALALLQGGCEPLIVDRGLAFPERHWQIKALRRQGRMAGSPPLTCGLGGAGSYSDGKLHTRSKGEAVARALGLLAWFAGDEDLLVDSHPHVGSNRLPRLVTRLQHYLESGGTRFAFQTEVEGVQLSGGRVVGVRTAAGERLDAEAVVLAPGNSARRLFLALARQGVALEPKPFAVGLRVEHPRTFIDRALLGADAGHPALGAARYAFAFSDGSRPVYSFCMCPGGHIIPTPPEEGGLAVNGMSFAERSSPWSNAALVTAVSAADWQAHEDELGSGIGLQRAMERVAMECHGGHVAPAQRMTDFLAGAPSCSLPSSSYRPAVAAARLDLMIPAPIVAALREGLVKADRKIPGYVHEEALLVAPETLTSSPVRFLRSEDGESPTAPGLFPCGEGSGWAGGITSSAADGLLVGERLAGRLRGRRGTSR